MCGSNAAGDNSTAAAKGDDVVPPEALAAALIMIVVGFAIILVYGIEQKRAWKAEQTYFANAAADEHNGPTGPGAPCGVALPAVIVPESVEDDDDEAGFSTVPQQNGISNTTLETHLLPPE